VRHDASFDVLYISKGRDGAIAEMYFHLLDYIRSSAAILRRVAAFLAFHGEFVFVGFPSPKPIAC
jgi:hypothetical protein